jgi:quercetin dioxygenase-like cupin family protein
VNVEDCGRPLSVVGTRVTILASNAETGGGEFTLQEGDSGTGPPPHSHPWDEAFFVLEGSVEFGLGEDSVEVGPGTLVHIPAGTTHAFRYGPNGGKMFEVAGQGSTAAALFTEFDRELPPGPPDIERVVEILDRHGAKLMV